MLAVRGYFGHAEFILITDNWLTENCLIMKFIDETKIRAIAGDGGPGCVSFHRAKFVRRGPADGGNGGHGGDVVAVADPQLTTCSTCAIAKNGKRARASGAATPTATAGAAKIASSKFRWGR